MKHHLLAHSWVYVYLAFFYNPRPPVPPTVDWTLFGQLAVQTAPCRPAHWPSWYGQALSFSVDPKV